MVSYDSAAILTGPSGEFALSDELRKWICYYDDGRLLVSRSHAFNPHVQAFQAKLTRLGRAVQRVAVDLEAVAEAYAGGSKSASGSGQKSASDMHRVVKKVFEEAVQKRASDIHFRVAKKTGLKILFRVNNDLEFYSEEPYELGNQMCSTIYQSMADVSDATFEPLSRQDARISDQSKLAPGLDGIRVATSPQVDGYVMVLRMLYSDTSGTVDLSSLGYNATQSTTLALMKRKPTGVNIIAGPTGSGKSTTLQKVLYSLIQETQGRTHVITVEDPPEYPIVGAVQTPVTNADSEEARSKAFQAAIKAAMRLDPDIIMIGEIRDAPSARLAVQSAMTGHQVWATIHANGAFAIIDRLADLGVPHELLCDPTILTGLSCQRLLKVLCPACKLPLKQHEARYKEEDLKRIYKVLANKDSIYVNGPGCSQCRKTGTVGRTVCAENIITDDTMMGFLRDRDRQGANKYWSEVLGGVTMLGHAIEKSNDGIVDPFFAEDVVGLLDTELLIKEALAAGLAPPPSRPVSH